MPGQVSSYRTPYLSFFVFVACGVAAIIAQQPLLVLVPFVFLLLPAGWYTSVYTPAKWFWCLCIAFPLSTEWNITPQLGLDFPAEPLLMALTLLVLVKILHEPAWFPVALRNSSLLMIVLLHLAWITVCCFYSIEPLLSFKFLLAKIWYIVPLLVLPQVLLRSPRDFRTLALCFLLPMVLLVVQVLFRQALYQFSFADVKHAMAPFFRNHVNYSAMLVCLLPPAWMMWQLTPATQSSRKWILAGIGIGLAGLLFAYSRGAWVALFTGVLAVWILRKQWMGVVITLSVTAVLVSTVWLVTDKNYLRFTPDHDRTIFHTDLREHLQATVDMKDVSTAERFYRWVAGARMWADKPVTGFGPNAFYPEYKRYTVRSFQTWVSDNPEHSTVHNYFLLTAIEQGMVGLLFFCMLYFGALFWLQQLYHKLQDPFYKRLALTLGAMLAMMGVLNSLSDLIETDKIGGLFWLCIGMIILLEQKARETSFR